MVRRAYEILTEDRFEFRKNRARKEAILCPRIIIEKMYRIHKPLFIGFVDLEKTFDNTKWTEHLKFFGKH